MQPVLLLTAHIVCVCIANCNCKLRLQIAIANCDCVCIQGGVIVINIEWYCNLDYSIDYCLPKYSFSRLDKEDAKIAKGANFRSNVQPITLVVSPEFLCRAREVPCGIVGEQFCYLLTLGHRDMINVAMVMNFDPRPPRAQNKFENQAQLTLICPSVTH